MRKIKIFDTTLRDGEQSPGCTMNAQEKLLFAKRLQKLQVDIIEAGFPISSEGDFNAVQAIAKQVDNLTICALARALEKDIAVACDCIRQAVDPRVHIFLATSPIHMLYKLKMSEDEVLRRTIDSIKFAKASLSNIQFSAEDGMRSDKAFLSKIYSAAIKAGATTINLADTVGISSPENIAEYIDYLFANVDGIEKVDFGIHCHNDLGMAVANSLRAIKHGATQIECTVNGIGERCGNASLEEVVMAIKKKGDEYSAYTDIDITGIYKTSKHLCNILGVQLSPTKPIVGSNAFKHESGIHQHGVMARPETYEIIRPSDIGAEEQEMALGKHSGKHALKKFADDLGYNLSDAELNKYFDEFKKLCDKKKIVTRLDIEALLSNNKVLGENQYKLKNFLIATKKDGSFATVTLLREEEEITYQSEGNGALDSSFNAITKLFKKDFRLVDYSLHAVGEGEDALGEAVVKLSDGNVTMTGKGLSTDIIEASLLAYINAGNKLIEGM